MSTSKRENYLYWLAIGPLLLGIGCHAQPSANAASEAQSVSQLTSQFVDLLPNTPFWYVDTRGVMVKADKALSSLGATSRFFELPPIQIPDNDQLTQVEVVSLSPIVLVPSKNVRVDNAEPREIDPTASPYRLAHCPLLSTQRTRRLHHVGNIAGVHSRVSYGHPFELLIHPGGLYFTSEHCFSAPEGLTSAEADLIDPSQLIFAAHTPPTERNEATAIWLGADIETEATSTISRWFYPEADYNETQWLETASESRLQRLHAAIRVVADRFRANAQPARPEDKQLVGWRKTRQAPIYLADTLDVEGYQRVEVKISTSHLFKSLANWKATLADLNGYLQDIRVHTHLSFPRTHMKPYHARRYAALLMWANEKTFFEQLEKIQQADYTTQHRGFRPIADGEASVFEDYLLHGGDDREDSYTYRYVPFRTPFIYGPDRYGYEIRIHQEFNQPDFTNHEALLETMLMWLQNPEYVMYTPQGIAVRLDAFFADGNETSATSTYVASVGPKAFDAIPDTALRDFLLSVSRAVDPDQTMNPPMHWVYALPFVPWSQRSFLQEQVELYATQAAEYQDELRKTISLSHLIGLDKIPIQIGIDLARWARAVDITSRYRNRVFYPR